MEINKQLFEDVLSGKLKGTFVLRNGIRFDSIQCCRNASDYHTSHPYRLHDNIHNFSYKPNGLYSTDNGEFDLDIVDFIIDTNKNMETKELKIEVPEGFEIDKENSSFEKIVFKKKETKPRSWEKYCERKKDKHEIGYFIDTNTDIRACRWYFCDRNMPDTWRNVLPSKELANAFRAYMQLISLRQEWIHQWAVEQNLTEDWKPDWTNEHIMKKCILVGSGEISTNYKIWEQSPLSFPTGEMAEDFKNCFIDLLEIAKPLI